MLKDVDQKFLVRAMETVGKNLDREVKKGKLAEAEKPAVLARLKPTTEMSALAGADFAVELCRSDSLLAVLRESGARYRPRSDFGHEHFLHFHHLACRGNETPRDPFGMHFIKFILR